MTKTKTVLLVGTSGLALAGAIARSQQAAFRKEVEDFCNANPKRAKELSDQYARETGQPIAKG
jgi:hypothetical protein